MHDLLSLLAANAEDVMEVGREADRITTGYASTPAIFVSSTLQEQGWKKTTSVRA